MLDYWVIRLLLFTFYDLFICNVCHLVVFVFFLSIFNSLILFCYCTETSLQGSSVLSDISDTTQLRSADSFITEANLAAGFVRPVSRIARFSKATKKKLESQAEVSLLLESGPWCVSSCGPSRLHTHTQIQTHISNCGTVLQWAIPSLPPSPPLLFSSCRQCFYSDASIALILGSLFLLPAWLSDTLPLPLL